MSVLASTENVGKMVSFANGAEVGVLYSELRGAAAQNGLILPAYGAVGAGDFSLEMSEAELAALLVDAGPAVVAAADAAKGAEAQAAGAIAFAVVVIGLAAMSKAEYTPEKGWVWHKGFPDLAAVLDKLKWPAVG